MRAIILMGGFGTRLRSVLPDVPKSMAPIDNQPFLTYLLDYLIASGITSVVFSVYYLREKIQDCFHAQYKNLEIHYAIEDEPLGTGGAMAYALASVKTDEPVFVLNGDTFVKLDYRNMYALHQESNAVLTMALRSANDCCRYGKVIIQNQKILEFKEKGEQGPGYINAGVYLMNPALFKPYALPRQFSFETDFLFPHAAEIEPQAFIAHDYFVDIGIPEDYERAKAELPMLMA